MLPLLRGGLRYRRLDRDQWRDPGELRTLQWRRLVATARHAYEHTPFYRRRFEAAGLTPDELRDPGDFARLAPTEREDLRDPRELLASPAAGLRSSHTSGSTGRPTTSYFDPDAWILAKYLLKARARRGGGLRVRDRIALFQEAEPSDPGWRRLTRQRVFSLHRPCQEILPDVLAWRPTVLYGFPSYFLRLAEAADGRMRPRLVFTSGEMLDGTTRRRIEQAFAAPVLDVYGSTETKEVAWQCPERGGYHVNADWILVEIEPGTDATLVTPLYNRGMPLLRYRVGDTGELLEGRCPCGRGLPLMRPGLGRSVDYLVRPDGSRVAPYTLTCSLEQIHAMRQYQVIQETADRVVVNVVPDVTFGDEDERRIRDALRPLLGGLDAEVRRVPQLAPAPSGKLRIVESRVESP